VERVGVARAEEDRLAEVGRALEGEIIVNVQGDEPIMTAEAIDVPPLAEQQRRADETWDLAQPPMDGAPEWLKAAIRRWSGRDDA